MCAQKASELGHIDQSKTIPSAPFRASDALDPKNGAIEIRALPKIDESKAVATVAVGFIRGAQHRIRTFDILVVPICRRSPFHQEYVSSLHPIIEMDWVAEVSWETRQIA
jgi:DNA-directed RNA polymerase subunit H (RpoH/RPB5)